ncbi:CRISPR-associated endonuclease Cas2 [Sorangium cellulosum]|uniref:CRISPR-associated endoribonuclease Cas2 n=1 Tax=Sorangium cellulosum TaxID=56 RepID=A0A4P2PTU1_SORCE|nr:CRISPR-associated endonuclease Cas2 [Sorangium cellulosum]AUX19857.1 CRISPR-associated endonuclease Cas2 [Sorangium cellulosum]AUX19871.1 CRISPR-associated endonuclease Cas2 [Sorangium cellulosum]
MRQSYIVSYDVCDPKRLRKIFKAMRGYGDWLQLSVWQCALSRRELVEMRRDLGQIIDARIDQVLIIDIGPANGRGRGAITSLGRAYVPSEQVAIVV